jgi:transcriptional regulator with XRE-family HTH domain
MVIDEILKKKNMSKYKLSKLSGVPQTTISDLCSGKTSLMNSSVGTVYKIAHAFDIKIDDLVEIEVDRIETSSNQTQVPFDIFKSSICHEVKEKGDIDFIIKTLESNQIRMYWRTKAYFEAFYLLGMVDYLSNENDIPICTDYDDIRNQKLPMPIYPESILVESTIMNDQSIKEKAFDHAIPEFKRFNIIENEVRNVV